MGVRYRIGHQVGTRRHVAHSHIKLLHYAVRLMFLAAPLDASNLNASQTCYGESGWSSRIAELNFSHCAARRLIVDTSKFTSYVPHVALCPPAVQSCF